MIVGEPDWETATRDLFNNYAIQLVPGIILCYDYLLTLDDEIAYYWPTRWSFTWLSALFLGTRYVTLLIWSTVFISMMSESATLVCGTIQDIHALFEVLLQIPVGCLCTIRVYALYAQDRRVLIGLLLCGLALLSIATYSVAMANFHNPVIFWESGAPFCTTIRAKSDATRLAMAWAAVLLYDILIFFLTALRAFRVWNAGSVVHVVLRDGVMYFCALTAANVLNIVNFMAAPPLLKPAFASLTNVLSVTFISRLMLNLRSNADSDTSTSEGMELQSAFADFDTISL